MTSAILPHEFIPSDDGHLRICKVCGRAEVLNTLTGTVILNEGDGECAPEDPPEFAEWAERYFGA